MNYKKNYTQLFIKYAQYTKIKAKTRKEKKPFLQEVTTLYTFF